MKFKIVTVLFLMIFSLELISSITLQEDIQFQPTETNTTYIIGNTLTFDLVEVYSTYLNLDNNTIFVNSSSGNVNITIFNFTDDYKKFNESVSDSSATIEYIISNFSSGDKVVVSRDFVHWDTFTANSSGEINFSLEGGSSTETFEFRVDNTAPSTPSLSCSPTYVSSGGTITCSCSATDNLDSSLTMTYDVNPPTSNTGTFTTTCVATDDAGNSATAGLTYYVEQEVGGTPFWTKTISRDNQDFSEVGIIETSSFSAGGLKTKERIKLKINNKIHYIGIRKLNNTNSFIEISSEPIYISLDIGEYAKVDVNNDKYFDIYVKLNGINNNNADMTIKYLNEKIPGDGNISVETSGEIIDAENGKKRNLIWLWILIGVFVVILIILKPLKINKKIKKR